MKKTFKLFFILCSFWGITNLLTAQTIETIATPGSGTWICPPGVTEVTVECWGGGGAGGSVKPLSDVKLRADGGTGGGYAKKVIAVTAGNSYNYFVGAGGIAVDPNTMNDGDKVDGEASFFMDATTVYAVKGIGGAGISRSAQTYGISITTALTDGGFGDVVFYGGDGARGVSGFGGAGGGSAGSGSNGNAGVSGTGGIAVTDGGAGGDGFVNNRGQDGGVPGGGGAGSSSAKASVIRFGGNGGNGQIKLTYSGAITGDYVWDGSASTDWQVADNWTPARSIPVAGDILRFNSGGSVTVTNVPANQTLNQLIVSGNTNVVIQAASNATLSITGDDGADFDIAAGSSITLGGTTSAIKIVLATGTTGAIAGNVTFTGTDDATGLNHQILVADSAALTFTNGSVMTAGTNFTGAPFGITPDGAVVFQSGSAYLHQSGNHPSGGGNTVNVCTFESGSLYKFTGIVGGVAPAAVIGKPTVGGKTYADFEVASPASGITNSNPGADVFYDNMEINGTSFSISGNTAGAKTNIKGNVTIGTDGGIIFGVDAAISPVVFNGTSLQTITLTENGFLTNGSGSVITIDNSVILNGDVTINGTLDVLAGKTLTINSGKTLNNLGTLTNSGIILNMGTLSGTTSGTGLLVNVLVNDNVKGSITGSITDSLVSLTAVANSGYQFINWTEEPTGIIGTDAVLPTFKANANRNIVANFGLVTGISSIQNNLFVTISNKNIVLHGEIAGVEIFNLQGKMVYASKQAITTVPMRTNGVFIVKMHTPAGVKVQKVSIF